MHVRIYYFLCYKQETNNLVIISYKHNRWGREKWMSMQDDEILLKLASTTLNAILDSLNHVDEETREKILRLCGIACAKETTWGPAIDIAEKISREETSLDRIIERTNNEISWCSKWVKRGNIISSTCRECGCPLVRHGIVKNPEVFCDCSKGWVETIFSTLLKRPVQVKLEKSIGRGDDECRFIVILDDDQQLVYS